MVLSSRAPDLYWRPCWKSGRSQLIWHLTVWIANDCNVYRINASRRSLARKRWISRSCAKASLFWCSPTSEQKNCNSLPWHSGCWHHVTFGVVIHLGCLKAEEAKKQFRRASQFFVNTRDAWPGGNHPLHMLQTRCLCTLVHTYPILHDSLCLYDIRFQANISNTHTWHDFTIFHHGFLYCSRCCGEVGWGDWAVWT